MGRTSTSELVEVAGRLSRQMSELSFGQPVTHVYNPLEYAWEPHRAYLERFGAAPKEVILLGMNPGPFGMAQTGVPFGEVTAARDWLGLGAMRIGRPEVEHPKRPVLGFDSPRSEVSGARFWGWVRERFGTPERFFARFFVWNYCPLAFIEASGRNLTPDKLPPTERAPLLAACDQALRQTVDLLRPTHAVGVGVFAERRLREALGARAPIIGRIPHPSPASPAANRGWALATETALREQGIDLPDR